jgi:hypothetical protein
MHPHHCSGLAHRRLRRLGTAARSRRRQSDDRRQAARLRNDHRRSHERPARVRANRRIRVVLAHHPLAQRRLHRGRTQARDHGAADHQRRGLEWLAPKRYASAETSGLTLIVDKPEKDALFGSNGKAKSRSSKPGTPPAGPPAKEAKTETKILASCPSARQRRTERLAQPLPTRTHRSIMTEPASFSACRTSRRNSVIDSR